MMNLISGLVGARNEKQSHYPGLSWASLAKRRMCKGSAYPPHTRQRVCFFLPMPVNLELQMGHESTESSGSHLSFSACAIMSS